MAKKDIYAEFPESLREFYTKTRPDAARDKYIADRLDSWKRLKFVPRLNQYDKVSVLVDPGKRVLTAQGPVWAEEPKEKTINHGVNRRGVAAVDQAQAAILLAFCFDKDKDICLYEEREMTKDVRQESQEKQEAVKRAESAEAELARIKEAVAKKGIALD